MRFKNTLLHNRKKSYFLAFTLVLFAFGCLKTAKSKESVVAEKKDVKTFEIVNLLCNKSLQQKYPAKFGAIEIELLKTSDSTLTFFIPEVADGTYKLDFDLAKIDFNVTQTTAVDAEQVIQGFSQKFDLEVASISNLNAEETEEVDSMKAYKQDVLSLFNGLSEEDKRRTALFYQANKEIFQLFSGNIDTRLDAPTKFSIQSDCPKTDFKSFYSCTADNLGESISELASSSKKFLEMMGYAGAMAYTASTISVLGPVAWGITATGMALPIGMAGYILVTEIRPAALKFKRALKPFLYANWIFVETLFTTVATEFVSGVKSNLNLNAKFRAVLDIDENINSSIRFFVRRFDNLSRYWEKMTKILGNMPFYRSSQIDVELNEKDILIKDISNPNVKLISQQGEQAVFESSTEFEENFTYKMIVKKEGFEYEKVIQGKMLGDLAEVRIGNQIWMLRNLNVSKYRNGDIIPEVKDSATWANLKTGAWCYHTNSSANGKTYGKLYNWYAVNDPRGLAPEGWHIPNLIEFAELRDFLGTNEEAGGKLKHISDSYWILPNDANNSSGFSALGSGVRFQNGGFNSLGFKFHMWLSESYSDTIGRGVMLRNYEAKMHWNGGHINSGFSVRCLKN